MPRYLFHAVDGVGLGHQSRAIAIAEALRRYTTDSVVMALLEGTENRIATRAAIPSIQIPPRRSVYDVPRQWARLPPSTYDEIWGAVAHAVFGSWNPDVLVHDTYVWPELDREAREFGARQIAVLRHGRHTRQLLSSTDLTGFSLLVYPHDAADFDSATLGVLTSVPVPVVFSGPIIRRTRSEIDVDAVRVRYGLASDSRLLVASDGGGNTMSTRDDFVDVILSASERLLRHRVVDRVVIAVGPLATSSDRDLVPRCGYPGVTIVEHEPYLVDLFAAASVVVCRGGYNSIAEVTHLGVPTVAVPARRLQEDQVERVNRAVSSGCVRCATLDSGEIEHAVKAMIAIGWAFDPGVPDEAVERKRRLAQVISASVQEARDPATP